MNKVRKFFVGVVTFCSIVLILSFGVIVLSIINVPRIVPNKKLKKSLGHISNRIGSKIVEIITASLQILHGLEWQFDIPEHLNTRTWYVAMSNHQSWADIFILLVAAHKRIPLLKFFMKKELAWIPFVFLANKTLNMPFVNRHSKKQLEKNPNLRFKDYENTLLACKRFLRSPSTIFSYAEGTRNNSTKHKAQNSPYKNLLIPRVGGIATALSAMPNIDVLVDYSVVYKSDKRGAWAFLKGDMRDVKVSVKKYNIPEDLKNKNYSTDEEYRKNFKIWIEGIWEEKDKEIERLKF